MEFCHALAVCWSGMNIGFFGGTFDPIHCGHLALAHAAQARYRLARIYFVPAYIPPHKQKREIAAFAHRYAMVTLATAAEKRWVPSLLEAPEAHTESRNAAAQPRPSYTIESIRRLKLSLKKSDRLFLLIGIDAFLDIGKWYQAEDLFAECAFIVASRPGYSLADVANALPEKLRPASHVTHPFRKQAAKGDLVLRGVNIHLLDGVYHMMSATNVREAAGKGRPLGKMMDAAVAGYIRKQGLYKTAR